MSQSEYIPQAVFYSRISPVIRVTAHSEEMLTAVSDLAALKFEVLKVIGGAYGNDQAYSL